MYGRDRVIVRGLDSGLYWLGFKARSRVRVRVLSVWLYTTLKHD